MKHYGFLVTDGDTEVISRSWGETREEARAALEKSLNPFHSIVDDKNTIQEFIEEVERGLGLLRSANLNKSRAYTVFMEDLAALKESLKEEIKC